MGGKKHGHAKLGGKENRFCSSMKTKVLGTEVPIADGIIYPKDIIKALCQIVRPEMVKYFSNT